MSSLSDDIYNSITGTDELHTKKLQVIEILESHGFSGNETMLKTVMNPLKYIFLNPQFTLSITFYIPYFVINIFPKTNKDGTVPQMRFSVPYYFVNNQNMESIIKFVVFITNVLIKFSDPFLFIIRVGLKREDKIGMSRQGDWEYTYMYGDNKDCGSYVKIRQKTPPYHSLVITEENIEKHITQY